MLQPSLSIKQLQQYRALVRHFNHFRYFRLCFPKKTTLNSSRKKFEALKKKSLDLNTKQIKSLERSIEIKARLEEIRDELTLYSKIFTTATNLKQERVKLNREHSQEITNRKAWALEDANTKQEMQELKNNELKNVCVYGSHANSVASRNSTTTTPASSPEKRRPMTSDTSPQMDALSFESRCSYPTLPPASPQDQVFQPMDIIYEDFDMPLASTSGSNNHPDPNSPQHEETHTLANLSPQSAPSLQRRWKEWTWNWMMILHKYFRFFFIYLEKLY